MKASFHLIDSIQGQGHVLKIRETIVIQSHVQGHIQDQGQIIQRPQAFTFKIKWF